MTPCPFCKQPVPASEATCPTCGQHAGFPNVRAADNPLEVAALEARAEAATQRVENRGIRSVFEEFLRRVESAEVVLSRPLAEVTRLSHADSEIYATFYQRTEAGLSIPSDSCWDDLRAVADTLLFGERNKRQIRFGALSADGLGLPHYGECFLSVRINMIAHRTSLFEENSVIFMERHSIRARDRYRLPLGYRASWVRRAMLVAAKLADSLQPTTSPKDFPSILLNSGRSPAEDQFMEVHIWGPLTVRSLAAVRIVKWQSRPRRIEIRALQEKLAKYSVIFEKPS